MFAFELNEKNIYKASFVFNYGLQVVLHKSNAISLQYINHFLQGYQFHFGSKFEKRLWMRSSNALLYSNSISC